MPDQGTSSTQTELNVNQRRLIAILHYLEDWEKLNRTPVGSVRDYRAGLVFFEEESAQIPDLKFNLVGHDGEEVWLEIPRLPKTAPPALPVELCPWVTLYENPTKEPEHRESISIPPAAEEEEGETVYFDDVLQAAFNHYLEKHWVGWAARERPRRQCIALYERLFHLQQTIENAGAETPIELVWGMGVAVWDHPLNKVCHPVVTQQVEILPLDGDMTLRIRPTSREPQLETDPYLPLEIPELPGFERQARALLSDAELTPSPFDSSSFSNIGMKAAGILDTAGRYWPDEPGYVKGGMPEPGPELVVTDSWVLCARRRTTNFLVEDLKRLEEAIELHGIPEGAPSHLVEDPHGASPEPPMTNFRGLSITGAGALGDTQDLFFPKPFNQEQVEIIQRLDGLSGVVVQGPPGTGKTHTIANVICHYLAQGKRVLVTSKGETALAALQQQIPEQIRQLTVSLLTNEQKGREQLEQTVNRINSKLSSLRPSEIEQEISDLDKSIDTLHRKIGRIDSKLADWANRNIEPAPEEIGGLPPEALARDHVALEDTHGWFPDELNDLEANAANISNDDVAALREARRSLADKLLYASFELPELDLLPSPGGAASIHECLCEQASLADEIDDSGLPRISSDDEKVLQAAERLLNQIVQHRELIEICREPWLEGLRLLYRGHSGPDGSSAIIAALSELAKNVTVLESDFSKFVATEIRLSENWSSDERLVLAIQRAAEGLRPFGINPLGAKESRKAYATITIDGSRPSSPDQWKLVGQYASLLVEANKLSSRWGKLASSIGAPTVSGGLESLPAGLVRLVGLAKNAETLSKDYDLKFEARLRSVFPTLDTEQIRYEDEFLESVEISLRKQLRSWTLRAASESVEDALSLVTGFDIEGDLFVRMATWLRESLGDGALTSRQIEKEWASLIGELSALHSKSEHFELVWRVAAEIHECGATEWAMQLRTIPVESDDDSLIPGSWRAAWVWSLQRGFLQAIDGRAKILKLTRDRHQAEAELRRAYEDVVEKRTWLRLVEQLRADKAISRAITAYVQAVRGMSKSGKGKRDGKLRHAAREAMHLASGGVPCWIMPQWRVSETLPATLAAFDLVIVDEASQSDAWALPALLRGKKVLVVGDDKQVGPQPSFTRQTQIDQIQERLKAAGVPSDIRTRLDPKESIYDLGELVFSGQTIRLREHFRCAEPIIEFSNRLCYDGEIQCVRVPDATQRLVPTLVDVHVKDGFRDSIRKVNKPEGGAIIDEIANLVSDPSFGERTIGVVSLLGPDQARFILDGILEKIGEESFLKHKIRCGDARTFQGSEADVIFISAVDDSGSGAVMTGNKLDNVRRINVAVSRARDRLYFYHSFARGDLSELDLRARLMDHFRNPLVGLPDKNGRELCESPFEEEMFDALCERGYRVVPQVRVGSCRIDMVVEGSIGKRLAVECDGDRYHGPDKWMADMGRQRVLERAGWKFWRCWGSSFARNKEGCIDELVDALEAEGIMPIGYNETNFSNIVEFRIVGSDEDYNSIELPELGLEQVNNDGGEFDTEDAGDTGDEHLASAVRPTKAKSKATQKASPIDESGVLEDNIAGFAPFDEHAARVDSESPAAESNRPRASTGDLIRYCFVDDPDEEITVSIEDQSSNPDLGIINVETPIAKAILGHRVEDVCAVSLPRGERNIRILMIESRH